MPLSKKEERVWFLLRIGLGLIFLWAFLDKLLGLGFATSADKAWISGGSPTAGFLSSGVYGPFAGFYHSLAGSAVVDWLFMLGLLGIGISLVLGIFMRVACYGGVVLMILIWSSLLPPKNHPFLDEHIIYLLVFIVLAFSNAGDYFGLGKIWGKTSLVKKNKWLK